MRLTTTGAALAAALMAASSLTLAAHAQDAQIDPTDPFAGVSSAGDWLARFQTEAAADPADPFHNVISADWWRNGWEGQWMTAHAEGKSFAQFYETWQGEDGNSVIIRSPYPYATAEEHWNAAREAADGGTQHTRETLPDWSGDWVGGSQLATGGNAQVGDVWEATAEANRESFEQILQSELEGRHWWPADTCLPNGYMRDGWTARYFMVDQHMMLMAEDQPVNEYRVTFHDGRGFVPDNRAFPQWYGQSQGFWDGDELVVWVKDIIPWNGGHGLPEHSDQLQIIERWKKIGDDLVADIVMYDPVAFAFPWHEIALFRPKQDWTSPPPTHNECVSTNNVYHDALGRIADFGPEDPNYYDIFDARPWAATFAKAEAAKADGQLPAAESFLSLSETR